MVMSLKMMVENDRLFIHQLNVLKK